MSNKKNYETVAITTRMPVEVVVKLDELCKLYDLKRSEVLINLIIGDYDKLQGNPQLKELLAQFKDLSEKFKQFQN
ncbi:MAG: hypothetical protein IJA41_04520 [Clostridia bacterium]|nr:hypothetical protein [Clostridia bacterium]